MFSSRTPGLSRLNKTQKASMAGVAAAGVAAVTFSLVPSPAVAAESQAPVQSPVSSQVSTSATDGGVQTSDVSAIIAKQFNSPDTAAKIQAVVQKTASDKTKAEEAAKNKAEAEKKAVAKAKADAEKRGTEAANRSTVRKPVYKNNLDGWIKESLAIMEKHKIPGSYEGLYRNIIRESSGNPKAINLWDINARNGIPSKGLLQVIPPTFKTYHVKGTPYDIYNPVSNIVAAANYAADRYGSMDNVNSAY
ncbi:transglycosylase SLT domain-containing protein [Streptomyces sp. NPDC102274]|uniref:transglycosylase SLT domain-containing protein n=1 Tax=Streptomyces sp. NPDC102274 TaxID=3366151 RepID=UPI0038273A1A